MVEFTGGNEKDISVGEPIVFENKTESKYEVCAGIVFHKSGIYDVSVVGNRTIVSEVPKPKTGKWIVHYECPKCDKITKDFTECCPFCGADMRGEQDDD